MPLMEHIRELRNRVVKVVRRDRRRRRSSAGSSTRTSGTSSSAPVLPAARQHDPFQAVARARRSCQLFVTGIFDALFLQLKLAIITGVIISSPFWLYQLWAFIAPGLYKRERRWAYFFVGAAVPLFALGGTLAYFAMTKGLRFLLDLVPARRRAAHHDQHLPELRRSRCCSIFGIAFELPLVFVLLNLAGVLTHERFAKWRRMIIFGVFAFAAIATPSPDPISMLLLAVPVRGAGRAGRGVRLGQRPAAGPRWRPRSPG